MFHAFDTLMEREVAIKEIPSSHKTLPRAMREARTAALLNHPNVVTVYEFQETADHYYLIMEYLQGATLDQILDSRPPSVDEALAVAIQVCAAIECAHLNNIIHRDIKPQNLMLLSDGRVKVMDFGIAKLKNAPVTKTAQIQGTVAYMSPEQAEGYIVDEPSDIFSSAVVLYEMLTGVNPFASPTTGATLFKIINTTPDPPSALNAHVPPELDRAVMKALDKYPDRRFNGAVQFRYKLERVFPGDASPEGLVKHLLARTPDAVVWEKEQEEPEEWEEDMIEAMTRSEEPTSADDAAEPAGDGRSDGHPAYVGKDHELGWRAAAGRFWLAYGDIARRGVSALGVAGLAALAAYGLPFYPPPATVVVPIAVLVLAAIWPWIGVGVGLVAMTLPFTTIDPVLGMVLIALAVAYWLSFARIAPTSAIVPAAAIFLEIARLGLALPPALGLIYPWPLAGALGFLSGLALSVKTLLTGSTVVGLAFSGHPAYRVFLLSGFAPGIASAYDGLRLNPWLLLLPLVWAVVAAGVSLLCRRRSVGFDLVASAIGLIGLVIAYRAYEMFGARILTERLLQNLTFSLIILAVGIAVTPHAALSIKQQAAARDAEEAFALPAGAQREGTADAWGEIEDL